MKSLVLWSSRTGNTKAVAEAIFEALPGEKEIMEEGREGNDLSSYDLVFVGFWGYRRGADPLAQKTLSSLFGKHVAIYATAGTWPDSEAAKMYLANAAAHGPPGTRRPPGRSWTHTCGGWASPLSGTGRATGWPTCPPRRAGPAPPA